MEELGKKRVCFGCRTKFYDFLKKPVICPNCGDEYDDMFFLKKMKTAKKHEVLEEDFDDVDEDLELDDDFVQEDTDSLDVPINAVKNEYSEDDE